MHDDPFGRIGHLADGTSPREAARRPGVRVLRENGTLNADEEAECWNRLKSGAGLSTEELQSLIISAAADRLVDRLFPGVTCAPAPKVNGLPSVAGPEFAREQGLLRAALESGHLQDLEQECPGDPPRSTSVGDDDPDAPEGT